MTALGGPQSVSLSGYFRGWLSTLKKATQYPGRNRFLCITSFDILRSKRHLLPWNPEAVNPLFWLILHFINYAQREWRQLLKLPVLFAQKIIVSVCSTNRRVTALVRRVFSRSPSSHHSFRLVIDQIRPKSHPPTPTSGVGGQGWCLHNRRLCTGAVAWVGSSGPVWSWTLSDNSMSSEEPGT